MRKAIIFALLALVVFSCNSKIHHYPDFGNKTDKTYNKLVIYSEGDKFSRIFAELLYDKLIENGYQVELYREPKEKMGLPPLALNDKSPYRLMRESIKENDLDLLIRIRFSKIVSSTRGNTQRTAIDVYNIDIESGEEMDKFQVWNNQLLYKLSLKKPIEEYMKKSNFL